MDVGQEADLLGEAMRSTLSAFEEWILLRERIDNGQEEVTGSARYRTEAEVVRAVEEMDKR